MTGPPFYLLCINVYSVLLRIPACVKGGGLTFCRRCNLMMVPDKPPHHRELPNISREEEKVGGQKQQPKTLPPGFFFFFFYQPTILFHHKEP